MGRLFWKSFFAFLVALLTAGVGVGALVWLHRSTLEENVQDLASGPRAEFLVNAMAATLRHGGVAALRGFLEERRTQGRTPVYAVDDQGQDVLGRAVPAETLIRVRRLLRADPNSRSVRLETTAGQHYLLFVPATAGIRSPRFPPSSPLLPLGIGILASLGFSALLAWYLAKPIRHLRGAFEAVAAGKLDTRIGTRMGRRRDEIADLGQDFDRMTEHLQQLVGSQRRLLHDVSHELRSPLARLQAAVGLARQQPEKRDVSLDRIEHEAGRLDQLVGELLTLSRLEAGMSGAADEEVDLLELIASIVEDARFEAAATDRQVLFSGAGEVVATVRAELLYRAFENVIRNALKYAPQGTAVEVHAERRTAPEQLFVTVLDRGPGVADSDLQKVFEPFFRSGAEFMPGGFGLGLAIARRAIEAHGGSIQAANREGGGLRVEIAVPVSASL